jgi:hypothetical protein
LAFIAPNREAVDRFHAAALKYGGTNEGAPGPRPHYGPTYYAAFVLDPDGYKLEAKHRLLSVGGVVNISIKSGDACIAGNWFTLTDGRELSTKVSKTGVSKPNKVGMADITVSV